MKSSINRRLRQARPAALDEVPGSDRQERDLRAAFTQPALSVEPAKRSVPAGDRMITGRQAMPAGRRIRRPAVVLAAAGTAVAVLAAVAGAALNDPDPVTSQPVPEVTNTPRAAAAVVRAALYEAAEVAGREADMTRQPHTFWHRTGLDVSTPPGPSTAVRIRNRDEQWISVHGDDPSLTIWRWADGKTTVEPVKPGLSPLLLGDEITAAELLKLPAEPRALREALLARRPAASPIEPNAWLFTHGAMLVSILPVRTETRAAGFRMLADLPGVRVTPKTKDPIGRTGTAVAISSEEGRTGTVEYRLVFDPRTSAALSHELRVLKPGPSTRRWQPGSVLKGRVTESVEWTTKNPPRHPK